MPETDYSIKVGQIGLAVRAHIIDEDGADIDVSGASTKQIKLRSPSGTVDTHTAAFTSDGTDGRIQYVTANAADLDGPGWWKAAAYVVTASKTFETEEFMFFVDLVLA
jgi:hypothetical protein